MSLPLVLRPEAEAELLEARQWYNEQLAGLGDAFAAQVDTAIQNVIQNPLIYPRIRQEVRRVLIDRFPYAVYFQVLPEEIVVLAVMHGRRHPRRWQTRR